MNNALSALSRFDSKLIGEQEAAIDVEVLEADALIAAPDAGMDPQTIIQIRAKATVGRFGTPMLSGYIAGDTLADHAVLDSNIAMLRARLNEEKNPGMILMLIESINSCIAQKTASKTFLLKAAEIGANRGRRKTTQANAPQRINFNGPTQINGAASAVVPEPAPE